MTYSQIIGIGKAFMISGIITSGAALLARIYFL